MSKVPLWSIPGLMLGKTNGWDCQVALDTGEQLVSNSLNVKRLLSENKKLEQTPSASDATLHRAIRENNVAIVMLSRLVTNLLRSHLFLLADGGILPRGEGKLDPLSWGGSRCKWPPDPGVATLREEVAAAQEQLVEARGERVQSASAMEALSHAVASITEQVRLQRGEGRSPHQR